jgi:hypothetical protein
VAGILANSITATMVAGDTAESKIVSGYLRNERIALSAYPAGTTYRWTLVNPSGSSPIKAQLSDYTSATPSFVPDVGGTYLITAAVDDAVYVIRIGAIDTAASDPVEAIRLTPRADSQVAAPGLGQVLYYSSDRAGLVAKNADGSVAAVGVESALATSVSNGLMPATDKAKTDALLGSSEIMLPAVSDATVPSPYTGRAVYYSTEQGQVVTKAPDGTVAALGGGTSSGATVASVTTANATETVCGAVTLQRSKSAVVSMCVSWRRASDGAIGYLEFRAITRSDSLGVITAQPAITIASYCSASPSFGSVRLDASVTDTLRAMVTGVAATSIYWATSSMIVSER